MPVIIGEYGAVNKENDFNRIIYLSVLNRTAETYNIVTAYWDNGYTGQYGFALFDRNSNMIIESGTELINAIMNKWLWHLPCFKADVFLWEGIKSED